MKPDLGISIKDYRRDKNLKVLLRHVFFTDARDVNRESGTEGANGSEFRRLDIRWYHDLELYSSHARESLTQSSSDVNQPESIPIFKYSPERHSIPQGQRGPKPCLQ
jgi:hypothetical protein